MTDATPLFTVVGETTTGTARLLAAFPPGTTFARLAYRTSDGRTVSHDLSPTDVGSATLATFSLRDLSTGQAVRYATAGGDTLADLPSADALLDGAPRSFRTLPLPSERRLRVALVSCNDLRSQRDADATRLWRTLKEEIDAGRVDLVLHAGDQVYADDVADGWAGDAGDLGSYRQHYVNTWSIPDVAAVLERVPSMMMWDDHEIFDGYGSNDDDQQPAAQQRFRAASQAFREFQGGLVTRPLGSADHAWWFRHGDVGIIALDGRSRRDWGRDTILGVDQRDALKRQLDTWVGAKLAHVLVVVGTPPVYVPSLVAELAERLFHGEALDDLRDGWRATHNEDEGTLLVHRLAYFSAISGTRVSLLAGDIHVGTLGVIEAPGFGAPTPRDVTLFQITSSGITRSAPSGTELRILNLVRDLGGGELGFGGLATGKLREIGDEGHILGKRNLAVLDLRDDGSIGVTYHFEDGGDVRTSTLVLS